MIGLLLGTPHIKALIQVLLTKSCLKFTRRTPIVDCARQKKAILQCWWNLGVPFHQLYRCCCVTDLTICGRRKVLSDGCGQVLPDRYTCPEPRGIFPGLLCYSKEKEAKIREKLYFPTFYSQFRYNKLGLFNNGSIPIVWLGALSFLRPVHELDEWPSELGTASFPCNLHISLFYDQLPWAQLQFPATHIWVYYMNSYIGHSLVLNDPYMDQLHWVELFSFQPPRCGPASLHMSLFDNELD